MFARSEERGLPWIWDSKIKWQWWSAGSSNIGRACSLRLVEEGAKVVIAYSSNDQKADESLADMIAAGGEGCAYKFKADTSQEDQVDKLFNFVLEKFGGIDILIYSAMSWPTNKVVDIPLAEWQRCIAVNLDGVFLTNRWLGNYWIKKGQKGGHILNFASQAAFKGSTTFHAHYAASKAGVVAFTVSLPRKWQKRAFTSTPSLPGMTANVGKGWAHRGKGRVLQDPHPHGAHRHPGRNGRHRGLPGLAEELLHDRRDGGRFGRHALPLSAIRKELCYSFFQKGGNPS